MSTDLSPAASPVDLLPHFGDTDVFRHLPTRKPAEPAEPASDVQWVIVDLDRYEVRVSDLVVGYIDVVGAVFVALSGVRYDRAVEVAQTLVFDDAVGMLLREAVRGLSRGRLRATGDRGRRQDAR